MPRRANNRVGVEVVVDTAGPTPKGEDEPHADSSRDPLVDGASSVRPMKASASAPSAEAAKAQRQKELLKKKKAERRAHAKQRAAEKQRRQDEKKQIRELLQMLEEDVPAVDPPKVLIDTSTSTQSLPRLAGGKHDMPTLDSARVRRTEAPHDLQDVSMSTKSLTSSTNIENTSDESPSTQPSPQNYPSRTEMVPKKVKGHSESPNDAARTIQKALKKKLKKCKTMFRQSPRVFAEEVVVFPPSTSAGEGDTHSMCTGNGLALESVASPPEVLLPASELRLSADSIADAASLPEVSTRPEPVVPPLQFPPPKPCTTPPHPQSPVSSRSCSSSCSCSDSGSCSSCSSCSSSCPSSSSSSAPESTKSSRRRRRSTHRSRTCRSSHSRRKTSRHQTARSPRSHFHQSSGPSSSLLPVLQQPCVETKYGEVHHFMATKIQAMVRGYRGRAQARQRQLDLDQELKEEALCELQQESVVKIQTRARGVLVRKKLPISDKERRRRRRRRSELHKNDAKSPSGSPEASAGMEQGIYEDPDEIGEWPEEVDLELLDGWQDLNEPARSLSDSVTQAQFLSQGRVRVFCGTWNMHAKKPTDDLCLWIRLNKYHVVAIGSEECVNSIAKSVVFTSKKSWEDQLRSTLGEDYVLVASHALTAIHNIVFVHSSVLPLLGNIQSDAVATGLGNQLGNKGGVGIAFTVGATSFAFINSHFDAHQRNVAKRNGNFHRINHELRLSPTGSVLSPTSSVAVAPTPGSPTGDGLHGLGRTSANRFSMPTVAVGGAAAGSKRTISERFDRVFWYGDLNYRINGTRRMVDTLLLRNQHEVLYANDQLQREMKAGNVFGHFREGKLLFRPTYKFDKRSDVYDSSSKQRIPSWTDRVLYLSNDKGHDIELLSYRSQTNFRTSDHRPVCAIFQVNFTAAGTVGALQSPRRSSSGHDDGQPRENHVSSSQACSIQ
ncbi:inositol polyphosphate 5-phosphatase [Phytophthora pseudosyringae]|uniref:Inositol polyphosphate 5-phosphatase n=1 Tax=Phytophthora pseudosyringae TaxID=221518 RepID=A0A8T1WF12_9STRA|nr:inositol polyphosphate 5-phosphatase [Phytophthora pseudosyringae]